MPLGYVELPRRSTTSKHLILSALSAPSLDGLFLEKLTGHQSAEAITASFAAATQLGNEERSLWKFWDMLLADYSNELNLNAELIGLDALPSQSTWFVSDYSLLQHFLMCCPVARRMVLALRWLEDTAECTSSTFGNNRPSFFRNMRCGNFNAADSVSQSDPELSSILQGCQITRCQEPWMTKCGEIPLFCEYNRGSTCKIQHQHRLTLLATLLDHLEHFASDLDPIDTSIFGTFVGDELAMLRPFGGNPHWRDELWAFLRSKLVQSFSYCLIRAGKSSTDVSVMTCWLERQIEPESSGMWYDRWSNKLQDDLSRRLGVLLAKGGTDVEWFQQWSLLMMFDYTAAANLLIDNSSHRDSRFSATVAVLMRLRDLHSGTSRFEDLSNSSWFSTTLQRFGVRCITDVLPSDAETQVSRAAELVALVGPTQDRIESFAAIGLAARSKGAALGLPDRLESIFLKVVAARDGAEGVDAVLRHLAMRTGSHGDRVEPVMWLSLLDGESASYALSESSEMACQSWKSKDFGALEKIVRRIAERQFIITDTPMNFWTALSNVVRSSSAHAKNSRAYVTEPHLATHRLDQWNNLTSDWSNILFFANSAVQSFSRQSIPSDAIASILVIAADAATLHISLCPSSDQATVAWHALIEIIDMVCEVGAFSDMTHTAAQDAMTSVRASRTMLAARYRSDFREMS